MGAAANDVKIINKKDAKVKSEHFEKPKVDSRDFDWDDEPIKKRFEAVKRPRYTVT